MQRFLLTLAVTVLTLAAPLFALPSAADDNAKYVLVTGTSTGIGRNLTETLVRNGHRVYAGVRNDEDFAELDAIEGVTAVMMDVTRQDQVDAVVKRIQAAGTGLYAVVNNAGIGGGGGVLDTPIEQQRAVYAVNVEGVYRVTQAFAPMVIESRGRIATTGSIAGTLSWADGTAYAGSKHWIEAFTDALAEEMASHGVSVSVIEPGNYQTQIRRNAVRRAMERMEAAGQDITDDMRKLYKETEERELSFKKPDEVAAAYMHALFDAQPLRRYVVTPTAEEQSWVIGAKIQQLLQLNTWGPHSYSRDELVQMLDAMLAAGAAAD